MDNVRLMLGDCLERLRELSDNSVDSVVTDPPYGLRFMGKKWDYDVPSVDVWAECLRVLKPGGHLLAFAGTRTQHRMAVRIEDAGFEIRDMIAWVYGSGFPKSHNLKDEWQGWGTALKPALEPITVARKPFIGTVAQNVLEHGTGAINVDGCRVAKSDGDESGWSKTGSKAGENRSMSGVNYEREPKPDAFGRWPANLIHDGSDEVDSLLGSAARFFYCAKTSKKDRNEGCEHLPEHQEGLQLPRGKCLDCGAWKNSGEEQCKCGGEWEMTSNPPPKARNNHPTVKPTDLMRYLCRLVTQPNGVVLDPFMGSGSTGKAAMIEGFQFIGIERDESYFEIARSRIEEASKQNAESA